MEKIKPNQNYYVRHIDNLLNEAVDNLSDEDYVGLCKAVADRCEIVSAPPSEKEATREEEKKRCQYELFVEGYFGLKESIQENDKVQTDYGNLVNMLAMFDDSKQQRIVELEAEVARLEHEREAQRDGFSH